jgi:C4-dicarboxylate transporter DctM subunit
VYGFLMNLSISDLFVAGILPGHADGGRDAGGVLVDVPQAWAGARSRRSTSGAWSLGTAVRYLGFFAIFIVIFGIYSGIFSPTEAAAITVGFCLIAGLIITREIRWRALPDILLRSGQLTGMLAPMIAISIVMQQVFALLGAAETVQSFIAWFGSSETSSCCWCAWESCLPPADPREPARDGDLRPHPRADRRRAWASIRCTSRVIFLVGAAIGFITPPFGLNLFVASGVTGIPYSKLVRFALVYMMGLTISWLIIAFVPWLSLGLIPQPG